MTVLSIPAQITIESLAETVAQLPPETLENFMTRVKQIRQHQADEAQFLTIIRRRLPVEKQRKFDALRAKLAAETLTDAESIELEELVNQVEANDVARADALVCLAQQRGISLTQLMHELNLETALD